MLVKLFHFSKPIGQNQICVNENATGRSQKAGSWSSKSNLDKFLYYKLHTGIILGGNVITTISWIFSANIISICNMETEKYRSRTTCIMSITFWATVTDWPTWNATNLPMKINGCDRLRCITPSQRFLMEANLTDQPVSIQYESLWDLLRSRYLGTSHFVKSINLEAYYLGFLNTGCGFKVSFRVVISASYT